MDSSQTLLPDPSFGSNGRVVLTVPPDHYRIIAYGMAATAGSSILVGLSYRQAPGGLSRIGLARLSNDGSLDGGFGVSGYAVHAGPESATYSTYARQPFMLPSGKILLHCATARIGESDRPVLARLHGDGALDTTFGTNGFKVFPVQEHGLIDAMVIPRDDGRILLIGRRAAPDSGKIEGLVMCLLEDGCLDASFGDNGILLPDFHGGREDNVHFGVHQDRSFVLAGVNGSYGVVRKFLADGASDTAFGDSGKYTVPSTVDPNSGGVEVQAFMATASGGYIAAGTESSAGADQPYHERGFIACIDSEGKPDPGFSHGDLVLMPHVLGTSTLHHAMLDDRGRLIVIGRCDKFDGSVLIGRYDATGTLDLSFGALGYGHVDFGGMDSLLRGATVQGAQGILISVQAPVLGDVKAHIVRVLNP